jgi:hypothetical protein
MAGAVQETVPKICLPAVGRVELRAEGTSLTIAPMTTRGSGSLATPIVEDVITGVPGVLIGKGIMGGMTSSSVCFMGGPTRGNRSSRSESHRSSDRGCADNPKASREKLRHIVRLPSLVRALRPHPS